VAGAFVVAGKGCASNAVFCSWLSLVTQQMSARLMGLLCSVAGIISIIVVSNGVVIGGSCIGMLAAVSLLLAGKGFAIKAEHCSLPCSTSHQIIGIIVVAVIVIFIIVFVDCWVQV